MATTATSPPGATDTATAALGSSRRAGRRRVSSVDGRGAAGAGGNTSGASAGAGVSGTSASVASQLRYSPQAQKSRFTAMLPHLGHSSALRGGDEGSALYMAVPRSVDWH